MSHPKRQPLSPISVITLILVLFFFASLGSAQLFQFGEARRRAQCANNLRQLALGVHNFHDVHNMLPPLATDEGHWTWQALLLPYLEQASAFDKIDWREPSPKSEAHKKLVIEFKSEVLLCPSRRTKETSARKEGDFKGGQPTDYIAVSTTDLKKFSGKTNGMIIFRYQARDESKKQPLKSYTRFGSVVDGLSNTAMIGEKHMLKDWLGGKYDEPALVAFNDQNTIRIASDIEKEKEDGDEVKKPRGLAFDTIEGVKPKDKGEKEKSKDKSKADTDDWKFGSAHPKICQFAMGDGSVQAIKNTADPQVLRWMCGRNDGRVFEFPK
jgi:hypothetical protein